MHERVELAYCETEYQRESPPYKLYLNALEDAFDFSIINSFMDVGCNNGRLIEAVQRKYQHIEIAGIDYFPWAQEHAAPQVRNKIHLADLAQPLPSFHQFDIVNCTEVGEHVEREAEDVFIENLVRLTGDILILTWSNEGDDISHQHVNPRPKQYVIEKLMQEKFLFWPEMALVLAGSLREKLSHQGYQWWENNMMVFKRMSHLPVSSAYWFQGISTDNSGHEVKFTNGGLYHTSLQEAFIELTHRVRSYVSSRQARTILRASDGDGYFLREMPIGSAKPGNRALLKEYAQLPMEKYRDLFWKNDLITMSIEKEEHAQWVYFPLFCLLRSYCSSYRRMARLLWSVSDRTPPLFRKAAQALLLAFSHDSCLATKSKEIIDKGYVPLEAVYALVASRWIFRNFPCTIGIIGAKQKLDIIKELAGYQAYRDYVGIHGFTEYIPVPQIGAADDLEGLARDIGFSLTESTADVYLVGAGSVKTGLLPLLKGYSDALFIDVGCGVDALAGIVCQDRPYFADWINFRIRGYDYDGVDFMDKGNPAWMKTSYKTVWLDPADKEM